MAAGAAAAAAAGAGRRRTRASMAGKACRVSLLNPLDGDFSGDAEPSRRCSTLESMQQLVQGFYAGVGKNSGTIERFYQSLVAARKGDTLLTHTVEDDSPTSRCFGLLGPKRSPVKPTGPLGDSQNISHDDHALLSQIKHMNSSPMDKIKMADAMEKKSKNHWIESPKFNTTMGGIILLNSIVMAVEVDYELDMRRMEENDTAGLQYIGYTGIPPWFFTVSEAVFTIIFVSEIIARCKVLKWKFIRDPWCILDLTSIFPSLLLLTIGQTGSMARQLQLIRMLRLFKLCRLLRLIKLFKELHLIVTGFVESLKTLGWVVLLMCVVVFTFAVFCTMTIGLSDSMSSFNCKPSDFNCQSFDQYRYFGSTLRTMLTLFQVFTLDGWSVVVRPVVEQGMPMLLPVFVLFIFLTTYGLLNLLIGVIVEHTTQLASDTSEEMGALMFDQQGQELLGLVKLFMQADIWKKGEVEVTDLRKAYDDSKGTELRGQLDAVHAEGDVWDLFSLCEIRSNNGTISFQDFLGASLRLQGNPQAKDLTAIFFWIRRQQTQQISLEGKVDNLIEEQKRAREKLESLLSM